MAVIRANRESVDDRFSVLGFTVRSELPLFEIGIATDPELLKPAQRLRRTSRNFFTSRLLRSAPSQRGEAVYLVPPEVMARFVGQPRLYFGLATFRDGDRSTPISLRMPDQGSMYVSLTGLTERGLRRTVRGSTNGAANYGGKGTELGWGGDALADPAQPLPAEEQPGNAAQSPNGSAAPATPGDVAGYSDGFSEDLWRPAPAATEPAASAAHASPGNGNPNPEATPAVHSAALSQSPRRQRADVRSLLIASDYRPGTLVDALRAQLGFFVDSAMWYLGVADTHAMPHAAICQIRRPDGSEEGALHGSGFFIGPRLILTAGHIVANQSELIVVPGKNGGGIGAGAEPFGRFRTTQFRPHDSYGVDGSDHDMALIFVPEANAVGPDRYFDLVEELNQSRPEGVVVSGYAARWYANDQIEHFVNNTIDPNRQHMMGGYIRDLPTDETFSYNIQTLGGTSGSPVYWIEDTGAGARAHLVGVHVAAHDESTNLGCRITGGKLTWIRKVAAEWDQTLTFAMGRYAQGLSASAADARRRAPARPKTASDPRPAAAAQRDGPSANAHATAQEVITPFYDPADPASALVCQADAFSQAREEWFAGVPNTTVFPHSAICLLEMQDAAGNTARGTGFYIGRNRILTCAHNLHNQASVTIIPGKNGNGGGETEPFGRTTVTSASWRIPASYAGSNKGTDLAVIDNVPIGAPNGLWFDELEDLNQSRPEGVVVCGYSSRSEKVPELTRAIDGFRQHLHAGYIAALAPDDSTFSYPILTLKRASGSPVYYLSNRSGSMRAYVVGVHTGSDTDDLNRGCRLMRNKIDWIEGRTTSLALRAPARALEIPLDPGAGGRSIDVSALVEGDIIVSTARHAVCYAIRAGSLSSISHAMVYVGGGNVVEAVGSGVREVALGTALEGAILSVAYRDPRVDASLGAAIVAYARAQVGKPYDYAGVARIGYRMAYPFSGRMLDKIRELTGADADSASSFFCSELVFAAFEAAGIPLVASRPDASSPDELVSLGQHSLQYVGHLIAHDAFLGIALGLSSVRAQGVSRALAADGPSDLPVHLIPQPNKDACWAAAMAMVLAHQRGASSTPESIVNEVGGSLASSYGWDLLQAVRDRYGFQMIEQPSNASIYHSPRQWAQWLNSSGPLWVVIVGAPHAVVVAGIRGKLDAPESAEVKILNPWDTRVAFDNDPIDFHPENNGYEDWLPFADFATDFGNMAEADYGNWRILYLPAERATAQSLAAVASDGTEVDDPYQIRLLPPPAPVVRDLSMARAQDGGAAVAIASTVVGAVMERLASNEGDITWELDQLRGFKHPNDAAPSPMPPANDARPIRLDDWPAVEVGFLITDRISAGFEINWQYNGRSVGNVLISNIATNDAIGMGLVVKAKIMDDNIVYPRSNPTFAALRIRFEYRFTHYVKGDKIAIRDIRLFGDGTYSDDGRWEQT